MSRKAGSEEARPKGATIREVAERADVSPSTVSRVLNKTGRISEETRRRVLAAASEVGYTVESKATTVVQGSLVAILIGRRIYPFTDSQFYPQVLTGIEEALRDLQLYPLPQSIDSETDPKPLLQTLLLDHSVKGFIYVGCDIPAAAVAWLHERGCPLALVDNAIPELPVDAVLSDGIGGAMQAVQHLIELGHERFTFVGGPTDHFPLQQRYQGFRLAIGAAGLKETPLGPVTLPDTYGFEAGYAAVHRLLEANPRPTAVVAANDFIALGVMHGLYERGVQVPQAMSVIGFDGLDVGAYSNPSLTSLHISALEMGHLAVRILALHLGGSSPPPAQHVIRTRLVVRESTARNPYGREAEKGGGSPQQTHTKSG